MPSHKSAEDLKDTWRTNTVRPVGKEALLVLISEMAERIKDPIKKQEFLNQFNDL